MVDTHVLEQSLQTDLIEIDSSSEEADTFDRILRVIAGKDRIRLPNGKEIGTKFSLARKMRLSDILGDPDFYDHPYAVPQVLKQYGLLDLTTMFFESRRHLRSTDLEQGVKNAIQTSDTDDEAVRFNKFYADHLDDPWDDRSNITDSFKFKTYFYNTLQDYTPSDDCGASRTKHIGEDVLKIGNEITSRRRWVNRSKEVKKLVDVMTEERVHTLNEYEVDYLRDASRFVSEHKNYEFNEGIQDIKSTLDATLETHSLAHGHMSLVTDHDLADQAWGEFFERNVEPALPEPPDESPQEDRTPIKKYGPIVCTTDTPQPPKSPPIFIHPTNDRTVTLSEESSDLDDILTQPGIDATVSALARDIAHDTKHGVLEVGQADIIPEPEHELFTPDSLGIDENTLTVVSYAETELARQEAVARKEDALRFDDVWLDDEIKEIEVMLEEEYPLIYAVLMRTPKRIKNSDDNTGTFYANLPAEIAGEVRRADHMRKPVNSSGKTLDEIFSYLEAESRVEVALRSVKDDVPGVEFATLRGGYITGQYTPTQVKETIQQEKQIKEGLHKIYSTEGTTVNAVERAMSTLVGEYVDNSLDNPHLDTRVAAEAARELREGIHRAINRTIDALDDVAVTGRLEYIEKHNPKSDVRHKYLMGAISKTDLEEMARDTKRNRWTLGIYDKIKGTAVIIPEPEISGHSA